MNITKIIEMKSSGVVLSYGITFDINRMMWITIESTKYDEKTNEPISWCVRSGRYVMSKNTGEFDPELLPSSRDSEYFKEYRFKTAEDARNAWNEFYR